MISSSRPTLQVVVLAAGYSSRLGQPKALATVHGASLLQRTVRVLAACVPTSTLIVVIPPRSHRFRLGRNLRRVVFVANPRPGRGLSSSVQIAIWRARSASAVLLLPVDLVELQPRDLARLISKWRGGRRTVVARRAREGPATPLILPRRLFQRALGIAGDQGLRDLVRCLPEGSVRLTTLPTAEADIDTPQALHCARRCLRSMRLV